MAFVILSRRDVAGSRTRIISSRLFCLITVCIACALLVCGTGAGLLLARHAAFTEWLSSEPELPPLAAECPAPVVVTSVVGDDSVLADRIGDLTGRLLRLEQETTMIASRFEAVSEFESRMKLGRNEPAGGHVARTPPGKPAGGPFIKPRAGIDSSVVLEQPENSLLSLPEAQPVPPESADELSRIAQDLDRISGVLRQLDSLADTISVAHMFFPGRLPVSDGEISSLYGNRMDPFRQRKAFHSGVDFSAPRGTPIHASAGGKVIYAGVRSQYGKTVEIDHGAGLVTRYAHTSRVLVSVGQVVKPGDLIAEIGSTGRSTGAHLHFEILKDGRFVDPGFYLARF